MLWNLTYSLAQAKRSDKRSITFVLSISWRKKPENYCVSIFSFLIDGLFCCLLHALIRDSCPVHSVTQCLFMWFYAKIKKKKVKVAVYLRERAFLRNANCGSNSLIPNAPRDICETCLCIYAVSYTTHCVALHWKRYYIHICNIWMTDVLTPKFTIRGIFATLQISITHLIMAQCAEVT